MITPVRLMYPKLLMKTGRVPGAAKMKMTAAHTKGEPKCIMPYGNHASTSKKTCLCAERIVLRFAP